jgi:ribosomal protein L40E
MNDSLDPEEHSELRTTLQSIGPSMAGVGLLLTIVGVASFFSAFGDPHGGFPRYFWCAFLGLPLIAVGGWISQFAFLGTITRYMAGEVAPVGRDMTNYMVDGTKDSIRDVAAAVGEGFASAGIVGSTSCIRCHKCNADNDLAAKFCDGCGTSLAKTKPCEKCGELNDPDARFCDNCGVAVA